MGPAVQGISRQVRQILGKELHTPDVVHATRNGREFLARAALDFARHRQVPFVFTPNHHPRWQGWLYREYDKIYRDLAVHVLAVAHSLLCRTVSSDRHAPWTTNMKIILVHNFYQQFGGEDCVVLQEKAQLEKTDDVFFYSRHNDEIHDFSSLQKARFALDTIYSRTTSTQVRQVVEKFRPDFAYVHNIYPLISPSLYHTLHACGVPILQVVHDFRPFCANGWFYTHGRICDVCKNGNHLHAIRNKCYKGSYILSGIYAAAMDRCRRSGALDKVDAFLCLTDFTRGILTELGIPPHKLFVRPNIIDASQIHPAKEVGDYVAYIGRLSSEKGLWTLMRALEQLDGVRLKIAGTGPLEKELREYIRDRQVRDVELVGFMSGEEKWEFLRNSRFVVMPSEWYETFGMVILEAYAAGKPVIASNLGGIPTLVENDSTGLLFNSGDATNLARQIDILWRSPESIGRMGANARDLVEKKFSPAVVYQQLVDIAQQVCGRHAS
jgi:glycosyltransferase involved in cell wall biosynthesis